MRLIHEIELEPRLTPAFQPLADIFAGAASSAPANLTVVGSTLYFTADDGVNGRELWKTDGTASGTVLVKDILAGSSGSTPSALTNMNGTLYFAANTSGSARNLWKSDGSAAGTVLVHSITLPAEPEIVGVHSTLYFNTNSGSNNKLWQSDGTSAGTLQVGDEQFSSQFGGHRNARELTNVNGRLYFAAEQINIGHKIWYVDPSFAMATRVSGGSTQDVPPQDLTNVGGNLYYLGGAFQHSLYRNGTSLFAGNFTFGTLTNVGGTPWYAVDGQGGNDGNEPHRGDARTLVRNINPNQTPSYPRGLTPAGSSVFFSANDGTNGRELWISDGTSAGTRLVKDIAPTDANPMDIMAVGNRVYFAANDGTTGSEFWTSDGTSAGTVRVDDINHAGASNPGSFAAIGSTVYFVATAASGAELYKYTPPAKLAAITSPSANGTYATGQSLVVSLTFDAPVTLVGGSLKLTLDTGAVLGIAPFSGTTASATYTVQAGETSPDLNVTEIALDSGTTLSDSNGNAIALTLPAGSLAANAALVVNPLPPSTVSLVTVNLGDAQRSRVSTITVDLATPVSTASLGNVRLTRTDGVSINAGNGLILSPAGSVVSSFTITFANTVTDGVEHGSLADGRWRLTIPNLGYTSPEFHRLFGDINGDATVDGGTDFAQFKFQTAANDPFDWNNDGTVDGPTDFAQLGMRFGRTI